MLVHFETHLLDTLSHTLVNQGAIIAGGHARRLWCIQDEDFPASAILPSDDIDFWCMNDDIYVNCLETLQMNSFDGGLSPNGARYHWRDMPYNLIRSDVRPFKNMADLLMKFDFTVAQAAIDKAGLWVTVDFMRDVRNRKLVINPELDIIDPLETMTRIIKYAAKGFVVDKKDILRMFNLFGNSSASHQQFLINKFNEYLGTSYA